MVKPANWEGHIKIIGVYIEFGLNWLRIRLLRALCVSDVIALIISQFSGVGWGGGMTFHSIMLSGTTIM